LGIDAAKILGYGVIGLGFLLALLAYRLLAKEQSKASPNKVVIQSIYRFMVFSFSLCAVGLASEFLRSDKGGGVCSKIENSIGDIRKNVSSIELSETRYLAKLRADRDDARQAQRLNIDTGHADRSEAARVRADGIDKDIKDNMEPMLTAIRNMSETMKDVAMKCL
jgi:hypothetical protein